MWVFKYLTIGKILLMRFLSKAPYQNRKDEGNKKMFVC